MLRLARMLLQAAADLGCLLCTGLCQPSLWLHPSGQRNGSHSHCREAAFRVICLHLLVQRLVQWFGTFKGHVTHTQGHLSVIQFTQSSVQRDLEVSRDGASTACLSNLFHVPPFVLKL